MNNENFFISSTHRIGNIKVYVWTDRHLQPMALTYVSDGVVY